MDVEDMEQWAQNISPVLSLLVASSEGEYCSNQSQESRPGKTRNLERNFALAATILHEQNFADVPLYKEKYFCSRF